MAVCSNEEVSDKGSYIHISIYKINKDMPETPKVTSVQHCCEPVYIDRLEADSGIDSVEQPQAADFSIKVGNCHFLTVFMRFSSKMLVYRIDEKDVVALKY